MPGVTAEDIRLNVTSSSVHVEATITPGDPTIAQVALACLINLTYAGLPALSTALHAPVEHATAPTLRMVPLAMAESPVVAPPAIPPLSSQLALQPDGAAHHGQLLLAIVATALVSLFAIGACIYWRRRSEPAPLIRRYLEAETGQPVVGAIMKSDAAHVGAQKGRSKGGDRYGELTSHGSELTPSSPQSLSEHI